MKLNLRTPTSLRIWRSTKTQMSGTPFRFTSMVTT